MRITKTIDDMRKLVGEARTAGRRIVLVPTMGYLHAGHLSLVKAVLADEGKGKSKRPFVVMSVFVNPLQFGPEEDLEKYPRDLERDGRLAGAADVDVLFAPSVEEMYPEGALLTTVRVGDVSEGLCGASRPGHFDGVATVVAKLFNICQPDRACFGRKDYQQLMVIRRMVRDLSLPVEIAAVPIYRESDGLALSSRNVYLSSEHRAAAPVLYRALRKGARAVLAGETDYEKVCALVGGCVEGSEAQLEYVEIRHAEDFRRPDKLHRHVVILLAARLGGTRLIDNILVADEEEQL